ncbi:hypothetical protein CDQ84_18580 [Clostridium thermosuccinogenes]|jgi:transcription elongation factor GreA|uniref:Transcription elongation factor GreA/GreB C-terminal domain-containing protein n=1 Tax=Clostridium thermosuccinogenes TaxID=84032 RepID=A0A2K2FC30_9CLOT|nr:GreA/GreB family elongation factor [Pseudoclostridium thermosuccinogenes]AUS96672.1 hypothetical protein CDO33_09610 [Pseudoclostridium thermosuccinogenes]PNT94658.1 hypothetical protein CDQ84_18580 [Pseudoclostridium thermosuccinogenes]PNT96342.1 hypothetical protein CDQ85_12080 [Pseudoclostridium thermosuccinogenes]
MGKKICLTRAMFEKVLEHLIRLEENKNRLIDEYYPEIGDERDKFIDFLSEYVNKIDGVVEDIRISDEADNEFPFVIIGSEVEIHDVDENEVFRYKLVTPYERDIANGHISFLSPMGKSLLLKKKGEDVSVKTPSGIYRYRIKKIEVV